MALVNISAEQARAAGESFRKQLVRAAHALGDARHVTLGPTPKDAVYREDKVTLYRYRPLQEAVHPAAAADKRAAVLICFAMINRPYMMDLQTDRSLIRDLLREGLDVFLLDWGSPDGGDRYLGLNDYVNRYLHHGVEQVRRIRELAAVNLIGVCQGGTLSLCYTAQHPERISNLITMVTPVDFHTPRDLLSKWVQQVDVDLMIDRFGNVSGETLNGLFMSLLPFRLMSQKYVGFLDIAGDAEKVENFLRMEQWIFDSPDNPGEMFRQFANWLYKENRLKRGTLSLAGKAVDLRNITMPLLNVYALQDHIVPPPASTCLQALVGTSDYTTHAFPGGHIGIYVSSKSKELPATIANWLKARLR